MEDAFLGELRSRGYIDGSNIRIEWRRSADMSEEKLRSLAIELTQTSPRLIVAVGSTGTRAALNATALPVVFMSGDPVKAGFAASLAKPGGNGTGLSVVSTDLDSKRLELLKRLVPRANRVALLRNPANPLAGKGGLDIAAKKLGIEVVLLQATSASDLTSALRTLPDLDAQGVLVAGDALFFANKSQVAEAVRRAALPAVFPWSEYHEDEVLLSYGPNLSEAMRRMVPYVERILKGAKPADLPIEQLSTYEMVINLRVARQLRLKVPQDLEVMADKLLR